MEFERYRSIYPHGELMRRLADIRHVALDMDGTIYGHVAVSLHESLP